MITERIVPLMCLASLFTSSKSSGVARITILDDLGRVRRSTGARADVPVPRET